MYCILVYDVNEKAVGKALKKCRQYLSWIQNSVFEGNITEVSLEKLLFELKAIINPETDSVIVFAMQNDKYVDKITLGVDKEDLTDNFI